MAHSFRELWFLECVFIFRLHPSFSYLTWFCVRRVQSVSCLALRADIQIHTPRHTLHKTACKIKLFMKSSWWNAHAFFIIILQHPPPPSIPSAVPSFPPLNVTCLYLSFKRPRHGTELLGSSRSIYDLKNLIHTETTELLKYTAHLLRRTGNSETVSFL